MTATRSSAGANEYTTDPRQTSQRKDSGSNGDANYYDYRPNYHEDNYAQAYANMAPFFTARQQAAEVATFLTTQSAAQQSTSPAAEVERPLDRAPDPQRPVDDNPPAPAPKVEVRASALIPAAAAVETEAGEDLEPAPTGRADDAAQADELSTLPGRSTNSPTVGLAPQLGQLLQGLLPVDATVLEQDLSQLVVRIEKLGQELASVPEFSWLTTGLVSLVLANAAAEVIRWQARQQASWDTLPSWVVSPPNGRKA